MNNYCPGRTSIFYPCFNNLFIFTNRSTGIEDCRANAGYVGYGNNIIPCPKYFFCPKGPIHPFPCPTYSQIPIGSDGIEDCMAADGNNCN
jgi:hypothetical protein